MLRPRRARFVSAAAFETAVVCGLFALWQVANAATHRAHAGGLADQYAALPSIHVGWALLIGLAMWRTGGRVAGAVGVAHAVLTISVVVLTANHYWFDAVTAAVVLAIAVSIENARGHVFAVL